jgi:hypothetical protein
MERENEGYKVQWKWTIGMWWRGTWALCTLGLNCSFIVEATSSFVPFNKHTTNKKCTYNATLQRVLIFSRILASTIRHTKRASTSKFHSVDSSEY